MLDTLQSCIALEHIGYLSSNPPRTYSLFSPNSNIGKQSDHQKRAGENITSSRDKVAKTTSSPSSNTPSNKSSVGPNCPSFCQLKPKYFLAGGYTFQ